MVREAVRVDINTLPEIARLVEEVERSRTPRRLERNGQTIALLVPAGSGRRRERADILIDTSDLPPIPYRSLEDLIADRDPPPERTFTPEEIADALDCDRAEAWRSKNS